MTIRNLQDKAKLLLLYVWFIESSNGPFAGLIFGSPSKPLEWTSQTLLDGR